MARLRLAPPATFSFSTRLAVRITDVNYGNHLGNDAVLSLLHEARMQYLQHFGYSELNFSGVALIMADAAIEFKSEAFYGDVLTAYVQASEFSKVGFDLYYKLVKENEIVVAIAKTGMVCFNYETRKVVAVPAGVPEKLGDAPVNPS